MCSCRNAINHNEKVLADRCIFVLFVTIYSTSVILGKNIAFFPSIWDIKKNNILQRNTQYPIYLNNNNNNGEAYSNIEYENLPIIFFCILAILFLRVEKTFAKSSLIALAKRRKID